MNNYELLKTIFDNFEVEGKKVPTEFITYTGKSKTYITYAFTDDDPTLFAEDQEVGSVAYVDIDIFSNGNYLAIEKKIKEVMKENNFVRTGSSPDMYENNTGLYHKTLKFFKPILAIIYSILSFANSRVL